MNEAQFRIRLRLDRQRLTDFYGLFAMIGRGETMMDLLPRRLFCVRWERVLGRVRNVHRVICGVGKIALAGLILSLPAIANASTATANLAVQLTVTSSCTIGGGMMDFGTFAATNLVSIFSDTTASFSVTCSSGSPYAIGVDYGANSSGTQRRLTNGSTYMNYNLYQDSLHVSPWTGASNSTTCVSAGGCYLGTGNGSAQSITIYGEIAPIVLLPQPGLYSDNVTLTINY